MQLRLAPRSLFGDGSLTVSQLCGDSAYLFFGTRNPFLLIVAVAVLCVQCWLYLIFFQASSPESNDYSHGYSPAQCMAPGTIEFKCEALPGASFQGALLSLVILFTTTGRDILGGWRLFRFGEWRHAGVALVLVATSALSSFVAMSYVSATQESDTTMILNVTVILLVNTIDEGIFQMTMIWAPGYVQAAIAEVDNQAKSETASAAEEHGSA